MRFRFSTALRLTSIALFILAAMMVLFFSATLPPAQERSAEARSSIEARLSGPQALRFALDRQQPGEAISFRSVGGLKARFSEEGVFFTASGSSSEIVRLSIAGADLSRLEGLQPLPGKVNVFHGRDPSKWVRNLKGYGAVAYREIFPGSDLTFRGSRGQLQVELRVAPGESLDSFLLAFDNAHLSREDKRVTVDSGPDRWILSGLTAYQIHSGKRREVILSHEVTEAGEILLDVGGYSPSLSLTLSFRIASVFSRGNAPQGTAGSPLWEITLGGSGNDTPGGMDHTADGDLVVSGSTSSPDFCPIKGAFQTESLGFGSGFVAKLNGTTGEVLWSTYFGDFVSLNDVVATPDGKICVTGRVSSSSDLPLVGAIDDTLGGFVDALVACFDQEGDLLFSSYLGGSGSDEGDSIDADVEGNLYLAGTTGSPDFPSDPSIFGPTGDPVVDAFVLKLTWNEAAGATVQGNQNGVSIAWGTYLGGSGQDLAFDIAVDSQGCAYVTGSTSPDGDTFDFPTQNAFQEGSRGGHWRCLCDQDQRGGRRPRLLHLSGWKRL